MKYTLPLFMLLFSIASFAEEPRHMISIGRDGVGFSRTQEKIDASAGSPFKNVLYQFGDIGLNYSYRLTSRLQIGAHYSTTIKSYRFKSDDGERSTLKAREEAYGASLLYNFSDIRDAWFVGYRISLITLNEENSQDFNDAEGKAPFELDDRSSMHSFIVGKRFTLKNFKLENLSFSPQVQLYYKTHGKDFDDNKFVDGIGYSLQPIRFDLFF